MERAHEMQQVQIFVLEHAQWQGEPLYLGILRFLQRRGAAGATVMRGIAGFGAHSRLHRATLVDVGADLPLLIVWVDTKEHVERLLPQLEIMVGDGMIVTFPVTVKLRSQPSLDRFPPDLRVRDVMTRDVLAVEPERPLHDITTLLLHEGLRSIPIVDSNGRLVGIITDGDVLRRGGAEERPSILRRMLERLYRDEATHERQLLVPGRTAVDVMTAPAITIDRDATPAEAIRLLQAHRIKRLPVVDAHGRLAGLVGRAGLLRAISTSGSSGSEA